MKSAMILMPQVTEDRTIPFGDNLGLLEDTLIGLHALAVSHEIPNLVDDIAKYRSRIIDYCASPEMISDDEVKDKDQKITRGFIDHAEIYLRSIVNEREWKRRIGAGSGIAMLAVHSLGKERATDLPIASPYYAGITGSTTAETLSDDPEALSLFGKTFTHHRPVTLSLEHRFGKFMIPFSEGRSLREALAHGYYSRIHEIAREADCERIFNCNSGLNKGTPELFAEVNEETRKIVESRGFSYRHFVCTNSFEFNTINAYYNLVISPANIVSYNEIEAADVYKSLTGENPESVSLVDIARRIVVPNQIVAIHSTESAIIFTNGHAGDYHSALELAVAGASLRSVDGANHTEREIAEFMRENQFRKNIPGFIKRFGRNYDELPKGFIGCPATLFRDDFKINNTGLGAAFGAILVAYLSCFN